MARASDIAALFTTPLKKLKPLDALKKAIEQNEEAIFDLNRGQLDRGLDSRGKSLGRYKSFKYKGRFQPIDLKLTGKMRNEMSMQISDKQTEIFSQDPKEAVNLKRYGKDIWGVPAQLIPNMGEIVKDDFINNVKEQIK